MSKINTVLPVENLESVFREYYGSQLKIKNIEWKHLTDPGENFGSLILGIDLEIEKNETSEKLHLVTKLPPKSQICIEIFNPPVTFYKELHFYKTIVPELVKFQIDSGVQKNEIINLVPRFFGGRLGLKDVEKFDDQAVIVLENLKNQGYDIEDRIIGLDNEFLELVIKQLAILHATTISYKLKNPEAFKKLVLPGLKFFRNETSLNLVKDCIDEVLKKLQSMEEVLPYMNRLRKTLEYGPVNSFKVPEEPWATLVHGDLWVNNMLFRRDKSGKIIDVKVIDFQTTEYENGCYDLIFLIISSAKLKVTVENLDDLIDFYYKMFIDCLKTFDVDENEFSREQFDKNIVEAARHRLYQCLMMVQVINAPREFAQKVDDINKSNVLEMSGIKEQDKLLLIVEMYARKGWLVN